LIIVSHDRYLLQKLPTRIFELTPDGIVEYKGQFDYYLEKSEERKALEAENTDESTSLESQELSPEEERRLRKEQEAEQRRKERRLQELEAHIEEMEEKIQSTEEALCNPDNMSDVEFLTEQGQKLEEYKQELEVYYDEWMELQ
ncbi:MAG: ABC transporter ATP-binding protein, partial [Eubacteriales bacterium]|nr:ABC transporter ATP-binding protein [Eubacteriales bacterium]